MGSFPNSFDSSTTGHRAERPTASGWSMARAFPLGSHVCFKPDVIAEE